MRVASLLRYPVKSMLGETVTSLFVDECGAEGDRRLALLDAVTGHVASAKHARLWRGLLKCTAYADAGRVSIGLPDGTRVAADDAGVDDVLSRLTGRTVRLVRQRPDGATLERPDPEALLELGLDAEYAEVGGRILEIAQATPGDSFTDEARCTRSRPPPSNTSASRRCATGRTWSSRHRPATRPTPKTTGSARKSPSARRGCAC